MSESESPTEPVVESESPTEPVVESGINSHLYAVKTTGGQEKVVMRLLEAKMKLNKIDIQSVLMIDDIKGYIVMEAQDPPVSYTHLTLPPIYSV